MKRMTRREFLGAGSQTIAAWLSGHSFARYLIPTDAFVESLWSGAITPNSARVNAKIDHDSDIVRLLVSTNPDLSSPLIFGDYTADTLLNNRMVSMYATSLNAGTAYYYGVESNGVLDGTRQGRFHTPLSGPQSFTFAFGSCASTGSEHEVFEVILAHNPLFGGQGFPLMHASALDRNGAVKGGPYSHGAYPGGGQYGLVTINDQGGDSLSVQLSGRTAGGEVLVAYEFGAVCCPELNQPTYLPALYSGAG